VSRRTSGADDVDCVNKGHEAIPYHGEQLFTGPSQSYRARLSPKKGLTAIGFQQLDLMAYCGGRHPELGGGHLKAAAPGSGFKRTQFY
jgi:hypothetical protein